MFSNDVKLKKIQEVNLEMAKYFVDFCQKEQLLCYFCGGGAIGAVRDKGLIPWDDDLDFFMPRRDYEKLALLWPQKANIAKYALLKPSRDYIDHNSFITIRDKETTFVKTYQQNMDIPHGITIDVFPIDNAPESASKRKQQKIWALIYALFCTQYIPEKHGKLIRVGSKVLLTLVPTQNLRHKVWRFAEKQMTKYNDEKTTNITELCVGPRYMGNLYPASAFAAAIYVPFEDTEMPIPVGYDQYLTKAFGNYMELPPVEKRVSHHDAIFIDPETPYQKYRHIYYLKKSDGGN